jgi:hypothetical protein
MPCSHACLSWDLEAYVSFLIAPALLLIFSFALHFVTGKRWLSGEVAEGPVKDGRVLQVIGAVVDVEVRSPSLVSRLRACSGLS